MSTAAIAASTVVITSHAAEQAAEQAEKSRCQGLMPNYNHLNATVEQSRDYAHCVDLMYPDPLSASDVLGIKVVLTICMIVFAFGFARTVRTEGIIAGVIEGTMFTAVCALVAVIVAGIVFAVRFVIWG